MTERGRQETVEQFFRLEAELAEIAEAGRATPDVAGANTGVVLDISRIPRSELPAGYPIETGGDRALALTLDLDTGHERTVFLDWPDEGGDLDQLEALLASADVSFDSFADLYGSRVPVEVRGDFLVIPVDGVPGGAGQPHRSADRSTVAHSNGGSTKSRLGSTVGLGVLWCGVVGVGAVGSYDGTLVAVWLLIAFLLLGAAGLDVEYVAAESAWKPGLAWAFGVALLPPVALPLYLWKRGKLLQSR